LGPLQTRPDVAPPQSASVEQPHRPVAARHCGCTPTHSAALVAEHSVHAPASGPVFWHAGRAGSGQLGAPSAEHATQACVVAEHTGVVPPQSALPRQLTHTPPPPVVSQRGVAGPQRLLSVAVQAAQAPVLRHTGNAGSQSALVPQARQVCVAPSQMGRTPEQFAKARQSTHVALATSQTFRAVAQTPGLPAPQAWQAPFAPQTGAAAPHSASVVHAWQVWLAPSQTGVAPEQSALATHATHLPPATSQSGVAPVQAVVLVAEHAPQAPDGSHACPPAAPAQSASPVQPRQTCVVSSQTGLTPAHVALVTHPMQTPRGTSQTAVAPAQAVMFVAEHAPQAPDGWQAGVAPPQSASPVHPRHVFVPASQTGFEPPHWSAAVQDTQIPDAALQPATGPVHFVVFEAEQTPQAPDG
jgi:hypothetical protein